ncbi:MAG: cysteine hydrolase [Anaerolineae bacterium]|nr:cysteine hydrolase [Anaerolineae bacterium]
MNAEAFIEGSRPFMTWLVDWYNRLETIELDRVAGDPNRVAVVAVDVIEGFCYHGLMASPRAAAVVVPVVNLMQAAWERGVRKLALVQDAHTPDAVEFAQWGPHCIRGTGEAKPVAAIRDLAFFDKIEIFEKNSTSPVIDTGFDEWLDTHPEIATFIVAGNSTDLSLFQLAMYLRLRANARQLAGMRVIVPAGGVATCDVPVSAVETEDGVPHDGDFLHLVFLYSMMQNGVTVIQKIAL